MIEFRQGEELTARKMNDLSHVAFQNRINGQVASTGSGGKVIGKDDGRNYIDQYRPFDVERLTATKLIVRGGSWEYMSNGLRAVVYLGVDDAATSDSPEDVYTITPTLAASTEYSVYLELDETGTGTDTLTAKVIDSASFPVDAAGITRVVLTRFETNADAQLPDIDPKRLGIEYVSSGMENDHSFHFDGTTITAGSVWHGDTSSTPIFTLSGASLSPSDTTSITYYIKVSWVSSHILPTVTWTDSDAETPGNNDEIVLYPILEFDSDGACVERCQSDIILPRHFTPKTLTSPSGDSVLWFDISASKFKWTETAPSTYMVLQMKDDNTIDFDYPRWNPAAP